MEWLFYIGWLIAGTVLYAGVCKAFHIVHFGVSAMFSFWFGCMVAVGLLFALFGGLISIMVSFIVVHYKWIIGVTAALVMLGIYIYKSNDDAGQGAEQEK